MRYWVAFLLLFFSAGSIASINVIGHFKASLPCPAYLSKNNTTNPDKLVIRPQTRYELREINRIINPDWVRVLIPDNPQYPLRWVSVRCGVATYQTEHQIICEQDPGLADSYVLALSWQPAFCQTYGYEAGKPECLHLLTSSYQARHFVLHGLWPNQGQCGEHYGFCGVRPRPTHCDYSPLNLSESVANDLNELMPGYAYGSCLERHEWNKHGSCQLLSGNDYFARALRLTREANQTVLARYLQEHIGEDVTRLTLQEMVSQSFGKEAIHKVYLVCKNGFLVDIFIQLPALLPENETLVSLVKKAANTRRSEGCPASIKISNFNTPAVTPQ